MPVTIASLAHRNDHWTNDSRPALRPKRYEIDGGGGKPKRPHEHRPGIADPQAQRLPQEVDEGNDHRGRQQNGHGVRPAITPPRRQRDPGQDHRQQDESDQPELKSDEFAERTQRPFMRRGRPHQLEAERRPVVLHVPDQDRQKQRECDQRSQPRIGAAQPAPAPARHQHERRYRRKHEGCGEFRQQRKPREHAGCQPPAPIVALGEPHQCPHHGGDKWDQRDVGRDFGHQQAVIERCLHHQDRDHHRADVMRHAPDDIGEQPLRHAHRQQTGKAHAEIGVAEDRGAKPDEPRNHRRMIEEGKHVFLRPGPVIGLVRPQIEQACVNHPHGRQRCDQRDNGKPLPKGRLDLLGEAMIGRRNRHGAFSPNARKVSTCTQPRRRPGKRRVHFSRTELNASFASLS